MLPPVASLLFWAKLWAINQPVALTPRQPNNQPACTNDARQAAQARAQVLEPAQVQELVQAQAREPACAADVLVQVAFDRFALEALLLLLDALGAEWFRLA